MDHRVKENRLRGSLAYPVVLYEMPYEGTLSASMHWQDDVEVLSLNRGEIELTLDDMRTVLHEGENAWINPGRLFPCGSDRYFTDIFQRFLYQTLFSAFYGLCTQLPH